VTEELKTEPKQEEQLDYELLPKDAIEIDK
jgi:hypothetical protein